MLVPAFSSKGFPELADTIRYASEFVVGPVLVSAYDVHYGYVDPTPLSFASVIFLDSGGYEASRDAEVLAFRNPDYPPNDWNREWLTDVWDGWPVSQDDPCAVFVSYDHPQVRQPIATQIETALSTMGHRQDVLRELLLKPETRGQQYVKVESVLDNVGKLRDFDIVGITVKELGNSILARMKSIAQLRDAMDNAGVTAPLHVFGSLDTLETPLYFVAGAEIFDGLTWLRYAYDDGRAVYISHYGALKLGIHERDKQVVARSLAANVSALEELQIILRGFLVDRSFDRFGVASAEFLRTAYDRFCSDTGRQP
jgi:hypothetical protein